LTQVLILLEQLQEQLGAKMLTHSLHCDELTITVLPENLCEVCLALRDNDMFHFEVLVDICGIDYSEYGMDEWKKTEATLTGFSRGVTSYEKMPVELTPKARFAVAYHLLSIKHNQRLRIKVFISEEPPMLDSVIDIFAAANWYEREAFDLYGILFKNHPDLRRILTDYGFIGHPFRKDFPLIGNVEMRYDATAERCIYDSVSITPRTLVPKVIREDHRYLITEEEGTSHG
jgi:NADH-quinone oxidoreductase subunit C